jgi:hypothetical protein
MRQNQWRLLRVMQGVNLQHLDTQTGIFFSKKSFVFLIKITAPSVLWVLIVLANRYPAVGYTTRPRNKRSPPTVTTMIEMTRCEGWGGLGHPPLASQIVVEAPVVITKYPYPMSKGCSTPVQLSCCAVGICYLEPEQTQAVYNQCLFQQPVYRLCTTTIDTSVAM